MRLPCLIFKLGLVSTTWSVSGCVLHAKMDGLGIVEITTTEDLSQLDFPILIHPWINFLLDQQPVGSFTETIVEEPSNEQSFSIGKLLSSPDPSNITLAVPQT